MADWADEKADNLLHNWQEADPDGCDHEELRELICDYLRGTARQARNDALEEAAKVADEIAELENALYTIEHDRYAQGKRNGALIIASALRLLKDKQP